MLIKQFVTITALLAVLMYATSLKAETAVITLSSSNTVTINGEVTESSMAKAAVQILKLNASLPKDKEIIVFLNTPGGSIDAGNGFIELVSGLDRKVVTVTSFAASMGYQIVQAFGTRYILESGTLMSHRAAIGGLKGQVPGEANSRLKWITAVVEEMEIRTSKRVGLPLNEYKELIRDELWLTGNSAVATKHADQVVRASCDASLGGTHVEQINTMFGSVKITLHDCPLISGVISVEAGDSITKDQAKFNAVKKYINKYFSKKGYLESI